MSESHRPGSPGAPGKRPGSKAPGKSPLPGQPGEQPGDEWGEDNPGNQHGVGVDDHVFFHRDGAGPHAGKVLAHGVHGCLVDDGSTRHKVRWGRVLGLKQRAVLPSKVVDRGVGGAILEHSNGRRVFVAGDLSEAGVEDEQPRLSSIANLEQRAGAPKPRKLADVEEFARAGSKDLAKADHDCDGPALCAFCRAQLEAAPPLAKAIAAGVDDLSALARKLRSRPRSVGAGARVPILFRPLD